MCVDDDEDDQEEEEEDEDDEDDNTPMNPTRRASRRWGSGPRRHPDTTRSPRRRAGSA